MRARWLTLGCLAGAAVLAGGAIVWQVVRAPSASARPVAVHTFLHIGCKHHNHGPKWHQDHGRILGTRGDRPTPITD